MASAAALAVAAPASAGSPQQAFVASWEHKPVVLRQTLYTLVYNERGRLGNTRTGRRDGLTVITPAGRVYFQFDGRQGRDDVVQTSPNRMIDAVSTAYQPDALDVRSYRKVEPISLNRFAAGFELVISRVRVDRDAVRVFFSAAGDNDDDDPVTSLTIKWPAPLTKALSERDGLDDLIRRFVDVKQTDRE